MSMKFYFDLESSDEFIPDEVGVEAEDSQKAIEQAKLEIEEMRTGGELVGTEPGWHLIVRDAGGVEIARISV